MNLTPERATVNDWCCRVAHGKLFGHWHAPPSSIAFKMASKSAFFEIVDSISPVIPLSKRLKQTR
jgi:hypothetical protein